MSSCGSRGEIKSALYTSREKQRKSDIGDVRDGDKARERRIFFFILKKEERKVCFLTALPSQSISRAEIILKHTTTKKSRNDLNTNLFL